MGPSLFWRGFRGRLDSALARAVAGQQGLLSPLGEETDFIAFATLFAEGWGLAVRASADELQAPERRAAWLLAAIATAITASGIVFMLLLLRPLARTLQVEMAELKKEIALLRQKH